MEQIYEWNPDMIIVYHDVPAKSIMDNSIKGQDWSLLDAWKNGAIYDVPRTTYSWITPCADSPLLPLWLVSKAYPDLFSEEEMRTEIVEYYQRNYEIDLTESDLASILGYREASGS
jgi:iron complex transport system substrate-binding protein